MKRVIPFLVLLLLPLLAAQQLYIPPFTLPATTCSNQFIRSIAAATGVGTCATVSLTADVTGTLPAGNGGTGTTGGAWTPYTPSATCGQSTGTAVCTMTGSYTIVDKRIWFTATNTVSGIFTVGTFGNFTLPFTPATRSGAVWTFSGAETGITGAGWTGWAVSNNINAFSRGASAGSQTIVTTNIITISGTYELP